MLRRALITALPLLLAAAWDEAASAGEAGKADGPYVDLQPVGLPVVVEGRLANYVFVHVRLHLARGADAARWRAKEPHFRDALVRAAHATPFTVAGDLQRIDPARLSSAMMRAAVAVAGHGVVRSVEVTSQAAGRQARPGG